MLRFLLFFPERLLSTLDARIRRSLRPAKRAEKGKETWADASFTNTIRTHYYLASLRKAVGSFEESKTGKIPWLMYFTSRIQSLSAI